MDEKFIKPLKVGKCQMGRDGRVTIPIEIRRLLARWFDTKNSLPMDICLMPNGIIRLKPHQKNINIQQYLEDNPDILKSVARAYDDIREGRYVPQEEIEKIFRDGETFEDPPSDD